MFHLIALVGGFFIKLKEKKATLLDRKETLKEKRPNEQFCQSIY